MKKPSITKFRISIFKSNRYVTAQIIDDSNGKTLTSVSAKETAKIKNKTDQAKQAAIILAKKAIDLKLTDVHFDRRNYRYQGRVKLFADTLRQEGLGF